MNTRARLIVNGREVTRKRRRIANLNEKDSYSSLDVIELIDEVYEKQQRKGNSVGQSSSLSTSKSGFDKFLDFLELAEDFIDWIDIRK